MIKEDYLKKLNDHLLEFSKQVGLPIGDYRIDHGLNSVAEIKFRHDFANKYREQISQVVEMFAKVPGIYEVCDFQRDDVLRGGEVRSIGIEVKRRYWYEGHIEKEWDEEQDRLDNDPEYAKKKQEEELEEKRKYWREYLIPIPKPPKGATDEAYLTLDYKYYDMIKSGEKTTEFREYSPTWVKRLLSHPIKTVRFQRGYGGPGHPPPEQMVFNVKAVLLYEIGTRRECPADNPCEGIMPTHIAIDLGERIKDPTTRTVGKVDAKAVFDKRVWGRVRGADDVMMKAKFEGKEVNVLPLNKVALYAVAYGWFSALSMDLKGVPERGEVYLFCDPFADEDQMRSDYSDLKEFAKEDGVKVPTLSKMPNSDGAVNGMAEYHLCQEDGVSWIAFENVMPLDDLYNIVNGEFVKDNGPSHCE